MPYRCVATSVAGFLQQLAVGYIAHGYYFYVAGVLPSHKPPTRVDEKILTAYDIAISKWTRARRKRTGQANVQYLRHGRFYVIIATHGVHSFFYAEAKRLHDVRKTPIYFRGYSIGCRRERGGGAWHASVRIHRDYARELKQDFVRVAVRLSVEDLCRAFRSLSFEPYAPVVNQLRTILRAVNRCRTTAGLEPVPREAIRSRRAPIRPFEEDLSDNSSVRSSPLLTTELDD